MYRSWSISNSLLSTGFLLGVLLTVACCDSIEPSENEKLVVEGFLDAGQPLPLVSLTKAQSLYEPASEYESAIRDASFKIFINDQAISYQPSATETGKYAPINSAFDKVPSRANFRIEIDWHSQHATAEGFIPPPIEIDSVRFDIPQKPVVAILVDTLRLDNPQVGARNGYIYPIDVTIWWTSDFTETGMDSLYWVEAQLRPQLNFSSKVLDVFLLTEEVQPERKMKAEGLSRHSWTGVYAVPVPDSLANPPAHTLSVQLIRSTKAYADFAASRSTPERREPVSNIDGAIGIFVGISLDALEFEVLNGKATAIQ